MKRRYANDVDGDYLQKRIDSKEFKGYICHIKMNDVKTPFIVNNGKEEVCIRDNGYEWIEAYPDNSKYTITIIFDNNHSLIEWYFDISKKIGLENGIPYEDDLYLDMLITPNGKKTVIDEDELIDALNKGDITKEDVNQAYKTLKHLEEKYVSNYDYLLEFTNYLYSFFK